MNSRSSYSDVRRDNVQHRVDEAQPVRNGPPDNQSSKQTWARLEKKLALMLNQAEQRVRGTGWSAGAGGCSVTDQRPSNYNPSLSVEAGFCVTRVRLLAGCKGCWKHKAQERLKGLGQGGSPTFASNELAVVRA
ncbi:unnamed protein product [Effrenium voratum]|nr:unnamed protein product [Effrenium voratum]